MVVTAMGSSVGCAKPGATMVPSGTRSSAAHVLSVYTARGGEGLPTGDTTGVSDPVGGDAAYTLLGSMGSTSRPTSGCCCGPGTTSHCLYNALPAVSGVGSSRPGRPGPNGGSEPKVDVAVVSVTSNIAMVSVVGTALRSVAECAYIGCFMSAGVSIGSAVGSAAAMLGVGPAELRVVSATGSTALFARHSVTSYSKIKPGHDDVSDVPGRYGTDGTPGGASMGSPRALESLRIGKGGSPHMGDALSSTL